jgi:hypothetical protein
MTLALNALIKLVQTLRPDLDHDQCRDLLTIPAVARDVLGIDQLRRFHREVIMTSGDMIPTRSLGDLTANCKRMNLLISKWLSFNTERDKDLVPGSAPDWLAVAYLSTWDKTLHHLDVLHHGTVGASDAASVIVANFHHDQPLDRKLVHVPLQRFLVIDPEDPLWEHSAVRAGYVAYTHAVTPSATMTRFVLRLPAWLTDLLEELLPGVIGVNRSPCCTQQRTHAVSDPVDRAGLVI